jgi:hypothetical protein
VTRTLRYKWKRAAALRAYTRLGKMFPVQYMSLFLDECINDPRMGVICQCGDSAHMHDDKYGSCAVCECTFLRPLIEFRGFNV